MACLLSEELWLFVFEQVLGPCEFYAKDPGPFALPGLEAILPLLLVCKQWQVRQLQSCFIVQDLRKLQRIAEPLIYRHVHIRNPEAARMLSDRIFHISATRDMDVWQWIRVFHEQSAQGSGVTMAFFMRAVNLIDVQSNVTVSAELLATLRQSCPSLRALKVWVETASREAMTEVGLFEHVKQLRIVPHPTVCLADLTDVPAWNMPSVTHFWWDDSWNNSPHEAGFISRCRFPHLQHLDITDFHSLPDLKGMPLIGVFLDAHRSIKSLKIWGQDEWHLSIVPYVRARSLQIFCRDDCPPRAFAPLLRPEVETLWLEFNPYKWERLEDEVTASLSELLTQFATENDEPSTLETICLGWLQVYRIPVPTVEERFLCALRPHVLSLNARGIRLFVDDDQVHV
jgi:hypothetical protein